MNFNTNVTSFSTNKKSVKNRFIYICNQTAFALRPFTIFFIKLELIPRVLYTIF